MIRSRSEPEETVIEVSGETRRILTEYVLNMAVTCLAHGDVEPLYEQYMEDPRLTDEDKDELARAYLLLQMSSVPTSASA